MAASVTIPNTFATQVGPIPLSQLDTDLSTGATALNTLANFSNYYVDSSGTPNQIVITVPSPQVFSYAAGVSLDVKIANNNTSGSVMVNVNSLGNKNIINTNASSLSVNQLLAGGVYRFQYDGTNFQVLTTNSGNGTFNQLTIGPPSSGATLSVSNADANGGLISTFDSTHSTGSYIQVTQSGTATLLLGNGPTLDASSSLDDAVIRAGAAFSITTGGGTRRLSINSSGNITVNSPASGDALTVKGVSGGNTLVLDPASGGTSLFSSDGTTQIILQQGSGTATFGTVTAHALGFLTTNSERVHIASGGNVSINPPSSGSSLTITSVTANSVTSFRSGSSANRSYFDLGRTAIEGGIGIAGSSNSLIAGSSAGDFEIFSVAGAIRLSTNNGFSANLSIGTAGNVAINAPTSGQALSISALGGTANGLDISTGSGIACGLGIRGNGLPAGQGLRLNVDGSGNSQIYLVNSGASLQLGANGTTMMQFTSAGVISGLGPVAAALVNMTPDQGTFNATFTGFTGSTNTNLTWYKIGSLVFLKGTGTGMVNTSNSVIMTISNLPASITPITDTYVPCSGIQDNGTSNKNGNCLVRSINTIEFQLLNGATFTASGNKGISGGWAISYSLQ